MSYSLAHSYVGNSLLSGFSFFDGADPTHGFVKYQDQQNAQDMGLYSVDPDTNVVRLGVDHTHKYPMDSGRPSVRLESKEEYNHGLFIADILHMPASQCGVWPAFWAYGTDWPSGGEIDIIEGVNDAHNNIVSGHTANGCMQDPSQDNLFSGAQRNTDCGVGEMNIGCGFNPPANDSSSYGDGFNAVNGGVYAMLWDSKHISVWHFPRSSIPGDIDDQKPDPSTWGLPSAVFGGKGCSVDEYWKNMKLVINTDFCGDYGNAAWDQGSCGQYAPTCPEYVANHPDAFANAYWDINSISVYKMEKGNNSPASIRPPFSNSTQQTGTLTVTSSTTSTITVSGHQSTAAPKPSASVEAPPNPENVDDHVYLGCFSSTSKFKNFKQVDDSPEMTLERCVSACKETRYAGVFESKCFCAPKLDEGTRAATLPDKCDHVCPGNSKEFCGGLQHVQKNATLARSPVGKREFFSAQPVLLTVYGAVKKDDPPAPPPMATGIPANATSLITSTVTYATVHPAMKNKLVQTEQTVTLTVTHCGCATPKPVSVPMMTKVQSCEACGEKGENEVTLTMPHSSACPTTTQQVFQPTRTQQPVVVIPTVAPTNTPTPPPMVAGGGKVAGYIGSSLSLAVLSLFLLVL